MDTRTTEERIDSLVGIMQVRLRAADRLATNSKCPIYYAGKAVAIRETLALLELAGLTPQEDCGG